MGTMDIFPLPQVSKHLKDTGVWGKGNPRTSKVMTAHTASTWKKQGYSLTTDPDLGKQQSSNPVV